MIDSRSMRSGQRQPNRTWFSGRWSSAVVVAAMCTAGAQSDDRRNSLRQEASNLTAQQLADLAADEREFAALPEARRRALADFADSLAKAPNRSDLESTMVRYARWLDTLTPSQKQRLELATSTEQRLATVRALIDEQRVQLDRDLKRLREHERSNTEQPVVRGLAAMPGGNPAEFQRRVKQLRENASASERRQLDMLRLSAPRESAWYSFVLGVKYGVLNLPANFGDWIPKILPNGFRETDFYRRTFGGVPYAQLVEADRARLRELIELSFILPTVTLKMVLDAYPQSDPKRQLFRQMSEEYSTRPFALVYYFDHPNDLFGEKEERFLSLLKPGTALATPADVKPPPRSPMQELREKAKRFSKKAGRESKDG